MFVAFWRGRFWCDTGAVRLPIEIWISDESRKRPLVGSIFEQFNNESRGGRPNRCGQNPSFLRLSYERTQFVFEPMMRHSWPALNCKHNAEFLTVAGPIIVPLGVIQPF